MEEQAQEEKCWNCGRIFETPDEQLFHFCLDDQERDFDWNDFEEGTEE